MHTRIRSIATLSTLALALTMAACQARTDDAATRTDTAAGDQSSVRVAEVDLGRGIEADRRIRIRGRVH